MATVLALLGGGVAHADEAIVDGDGLTPISANALAFGDVCANTTVTKNVVLALTRTTNGNPNIFKNSSTVSVTVGAATPVGTGVSAVVPAPPAVSNIITMPSTWATSAVGTASPTMSSRITLVAGSVAGAVNASVPYTATGTNVNNDAIVRTTSLPVTANVVSCDSTPPTLNLPANQTVEATGPSGAVSTFTATATDANPANPTVTCSPLSGSTFAIATTTVNCSATDAAGNTANGSFTVTVRDTTGPAITAGSNVVAEAAGASGAVVTYTSPTATDIVDGARAVTCVPASGSTFPLGTNTIGCTASDTRGNTSSSTFSVTINDTTAPALTLPGTTTKEATGPSGAVVTFAATASDLVDGARPVTCVPASGSTFAVGTTSVSCSASDAHGNPASGSFNVVVVDTTAPAVTVPASFTLEATGPSGATTTYTASAGDLVDGALAANCSVASGSTLALGAHLINCSATDAHGNSGAASFTVTVVDTTPATLHLPADITMEATGPSGAVATFSATASDLVDGAVPVSCAPPSGSAFAVGATTVDCSTTDSHGNLATGSFSVTITDTTAPALTVPDDITTEATSADGAVVTFAASASDVVDGDVSVDCVPASGSTFALGTTTVDCSATDAHDNPVDDTFSVTVEDTTAPAIDGTPSDLEVEATHATGAEITYTAPTATDIVDGEVSVDCVPASGSTFAIDVDTLVTCTAVDAAGNQAQSTFTIRVSDTSAPVLSLPDDIVGEATGPDGAAATFDPTATDAVDGPVIVDCTPPSGATFALGATSVDCSAADAHSNSASGSFTVTIVDTTAPSLDLPADIDAEATSADGAVVSFDPSATDLVDGAVAVSCTPASGATFVLGTTTVDCTSTDAHDNTATGSFTVTVHDTTAPTLDLPADIDAEATSADGAAVTFDATATDLVDGAVFVDCAPPSGSTFALGTTTVDCSSTDLHGNTATGSFTVTVHDTTAPTLDLPADIVAEATGADGAAVTFAATALDAVDGTLVPECTPPSDSTFALGTTSVDCSSTDAHGNTATGSFSVTVHDTTAPSIGSPSDVVQEATGPGGATVTYTAPSATDAVDGTVAVTCVPPSGSTFSIGDSTVTCRASDAAGNAAERGFTVTVHDTTAPTLLLPGDITAEATGPAGAVVAFTASASDVVDGTVPVTCVPATGSTFALGNTTVHCDAADSAANPTAGSFTVTVVDTTAPALTLPANIVLEATGPTGAVASFSTSALDVVDGALAPTCSRASGSTFALGTTTVNCSVTDAHSNTATGSFTVTVRDTTKPVLTLPASISRVATSSAGAPATYTASANDIVDGSVLVTCTPSSGSMFSPGITTANCSATDANGNTQTGAFTVAVSFDLTGGLLPPVGKPGVINGVKAGSTVPLKWQVRNATGGYITSTSIVSAFVLTRINCLTSSSLDPVDFTTTGATVLRVSDNQFVQNWQTPSKPGNCYRVDIVFVGGLQTITATFQLK